MGEQRQFSASGSATGIGDILIRLKKAATSLGPTDLALALDVRLPTGQEENLLGSGALGLKPTFILSLARERFSPYVNFGYQWNGNSLLSGDIEERQEGSMPDQLSYSAGMDISVRRNLSMAVEMRGRRVLESPRLFPTLFYGLDPGRTTFPNIHFAHDSFNMLDGGIGLKFNPGTNFLMNLNLLFRADSNGVRDSVTPMIGLEYGF